eukprot:745818-Hanusia_phi.AAC.5
MQSDQLHSDERAKAGERKMRLRAPARDIFPSSSQSPVPTARQELSEKPREGCDGNLQRGLERGLRKDCLQRGEAGRRHGELTSGQKMR